MHDTASPTLAPLPRRSHQPLAAAPPEPAVDWPEVARLLLASRALDQIEEAELLPAGQVRYQFSARGHELAQILLLDKVIMHLEADLRWLDMIEMRMETIKGQPMPEPEIRPRGRPRKSD